MKITPNYEKLVEQKAAEIRSRYATMMDEIVAPYSKTEQSTWFSQVQEADKFLADPTAQTPMLSALAENRGVSLADLATWVKENESAYRVAVGSILGQQQKELDDLYRAV